MSRQQGGCNTLAVYPISADPITFGHVNVAERVAKTFSRVIVAIGENPAKKYLFSSSERAGLARQALKHVPNVEVRTFKGLAVDFAYEQGASVIIKGVRSANDFDYEQVLHQVGTSQKLGIDTHLLFAEPSLTHISSSAAKALQIEQGVIHEYVPLPVKAMLEHRLSDQIIIGVTGQIASGKSTLCRDIVRVAPQMGIQAHDIDMDALGHEILGNDESPYAVEARRQVVETFGQDIVESGAIVRKNLGEKVFGNPDGLEKLNKIMEKPFLLKLRRAIYDKKGLIFLNAALIVESQMIDLCNNRVVVTTIDEETQLKRCIERGYTEENAKARIAAQLSGEEKIKIVQAEIDRAGFGKLWEYRSDGIRVNKLLADIFSHCK